MLWTASGIAFLQQMDGFTGICRDWAEVWIGLDGSAGDHLEIFRAQEPDWRVLAEFGLGPAAEPAR